MAIATTSGMARHYWVLITLVLTTIVLGFNIQNGSCETGGPCKPRLLKPRREH